MASQSPVHTMIREQMRVATRASCRSHPEIDAEPGSAHDGGKVGEKLRLGFPVHDFQISFVYFCGLRCMMADISGQVIQIVQPVIIQAGSLDPADLCKVMSAFRPYGCLDIALDGKNFTAYEVIAFAHTVHTIFGTVYLGAAF